jgi:hypothetical protein
VLAEIGVGLILLNVGYTTAFPEVVWVAWSWIPTSTNMRSRVHEAITVLITRSIPLFVLLRSLFLNFLRWYEACAQQAE